MIQRTGMQHKDRDWGGGPVGSWGGRTIGGANTTHSIEVVPSGWNKIYESSASKGQRAPLTVKR